MLLASIDSVNICRQLANRTLNDERDVDYGRHGLRRLLQNPEINGCSAKVVISAGGMQDIFA